MDVKTLICFCKYPNPGFVKSRLSKDVGNLQASNIYKIILEHTIQNICTNEFKVELYCYPNTEHSFFNYLKDKYKVSLHCQVGDDLGIRMCNAFNECLKNNLKVVLIGSDCVELTSAYIANAFQELGNGSNIVLGPTYDGGYALIGLYQVDKSLFKNISWSTDKVLEQTKECIIHNNWSCTFLHKIRDIDTISDYRYFCSHKTYSHLFSSIKKENNLAC